MSLTSFMREQISDPNDIENMNPEAIKSRIEIVKMAMKAGKPLSPFDLVIYTTLIINDPRTFEETSPTSEVNARKLLAKWASVIEQKRVGTFEPSGGWQTALSLGGWSTIPNMFTGWGDDKELPFLAMDFCLERAGDIRDNNCVFGISSEIGKLRESHAKSLESTANYIAESLNEKVEA